MASATVVAGEAPETDSDSDGDHIFDSVAPAAAASGAPQRGGNWQRRHVALQQPNWSGPNAPKVEEDTKSPYQSVLQERLVAEQRALRRAAVDYFTRQARPLGDTLHKTGVDALSTHSVLQDASTTIRRVADTVYKVDKLCAGALAMGAMLPDDLSGDNFPGVVHGWRRGEPHADD